MYVFNVSKEFKESGHITITLKVQIQSLKLSLMSSAVFYKSKYKLHFHDQKGLKCL